MKTMFCSVDYVRCCELPYETAEEGSRLPARLASLNVARNNNNNMVVEEFSPMVYAYDNL